MKIIFHLFRYLVVSMVQRRKKTAGGRMDQIYPSGESVKNPEVIMKSQEKYLRSLYGDGVYAGYQRRIRKRIPNIMDIPAATRKAIRT